MSANGEQTRRPIPDAEVIQEWADVETGGASFERGRMEAAVRAVCFDKLATLPSHLVPGAGDGPKAKKEDVDLLVSTLQLPNRLEAERALLRSNGSVSKALSELVLPREDWP